jgi:hypothetical protein
VYVSSVILLNRPFSIKYFSSRAGIRDSGRIIREARSRHWGSALLLKGDQTGTGARRNGIRSGLKENLSARRETGNGDPELQLVP